MTPDQLENTMQFIVEQQAALTAKVHRHDDAIAELEKADVESKQDLQTAADLIGRLARTETHLAESMNAMRQEMNGRSKVTDEHLNALILTVDKIIRDHDNGGAKP